MRAWLLSIAIVTACLACATPTQQVASKPKECRIMKPTGSRIAREVCGPVRDGTEMLQNTIKGGGAGAISPAVK